jgi:transcriptional regulator with XRE-family HTH domain
MRIVQSQTGSEFGIHLEAAIAQPTERPILHRIAEVRRQHNVSVRALASRMKTSDALVRQQEEKTCDLPLSILYKWQAALDVPIVELLVEPGPGLSPNVRCRAALLKMMKTVRSMEERVGSEPVSYLVQGLVAQLTELMPELAQVDAWPMVGKRRTGGEISPIEERVMPAGLLDSGWGEWTEID